MDAEAVIEALVRDLQQIPGVVAIVLGGSRARGTHTLRSDIDLALYYRPDDPPDLVRLGALSMSVDDTHWPDLVTDIESLVP
jgi:predicted nucleotidyltransferase